jgi:hypothetical protein
MPQGAAGRNSSRLALPRALFRLFAWASAPWIRPLGEGMLGAENSTEQAIHRRSERPLGRPERREELIFL